VLANRGRRLVHDCVLRRAAVREGEVVVDEIERDAGHVGRKHPEALLEQLLPGLVACEDDDRALVAHRRAV